MPADAVLAIFAATYVAMAIGRIPGLRTDRAGSGSWHRGYGCSARCPSKS